MVAISALLIPRAPNASICSTPECLKAAQDILADIDLNADPCSDFYQYTCGSWQKRATILDDKVSNGTFETLIDATNQQMRSILEGTYQDVFKNISGSDEGFHIDDTKDDEQVFTTMQEYYQQCMNESAIDALGPTPIYSDLALIENKLFPVNDSTALFSNNANKSMIDTLTLLQRSAVTALVNPFIFGDDKNPGMTSIWLDQPTFTLPSKEYYANADVLELLRSSLNEVIYQVIGDFNNGTAHDGDLRAAESNRTGFIRWSQEKVQGAVNRSIEFETKLANISLPSSELQNRVATYHPTALSSLQANNTAIDWTGLFNSLVPEGGKKPGSNTTINVRSPPYYNGLNELLPSSNITLQTIQEYLIIRFVLSKISSLDSGSRALLQQMSGKVGGGSSVVSERWVDCVTDTSSFYSNSIGRYYVFKNFGGEAEREKAEKFITSIHEQWLYQMNYIDWLDEETRAKAIEKLNLIKHKAAYSIVSPDLRNPASIREYNDGLFVNKTSFYDTKSISNEWVSKNLWKRVDQKIDRDEWLMPAQTINAYYNANNNEIVVPAGILHAPFYSFDSPEYMNYGGIGMIIAHEIAHAFDSNGRSFDGNGYMTDWWTNTTNSRFQEKSQCYIDQYSKLNITAGNKTLNVNGKLTLGENIADNGGLHVSYLAYQTLQANKTSERLQGLEQLSPEALFYVNFGRIWCSKLRDQVAEQLIYTDPHSPNNIRVNGAVQNNQDFATIFNCPVGSPMNPENKCKMWN